jgi:hypothetical protein
MADDDNTKQAEQELLRQLQEFIKHGGAYEEAVAMLKAAYEQREVETDEKGSTSRKH